MEPLHQLVAVLLSPRATAFISEVLVVEDVRLAAVLVVHLVLPQSEVTLDSYHEAAHTHVHTQTDTDIHKHKHTRTHTSTYTNNAHTHTHTHRHAYTHTSIRIRFCEMRTTTKEITNY